MPKLTEKSYPFVTDGQTDGPTLIIEKLRFKKSLDTMDSTNLEPTNQNSIDILKVLELTNKITWLKIDNL